MILTRTCLAMTNKEDAVPFSLQNRWSLKLYKIHKTQLFFCEFYICKTNFYNRTSVRRLLRQTKLTASWVESNNTLKLLHFYSQFPIFIFDIFYLATYLINESTCSNKHLRWNFRQKNVATNHFFKKLHLWSLTYCWKWRLTTIDNHK